MLTLCVGCETRSRRGALNELALARDTQVVFRGRDEDGLALSQRALPRFGRQTQATTGDKGNARALARDTQGGKVGSAGRDGQLEFLCGSEEAIRVWAGVLGSEANRRER